MGSSIRIPYANKHEGGGHGCRNLVVICMDFRFRKELVELLEKAGFPEFDLVSLPGASKAIIDEAARKAVFGAIDIAVEKHHCQRVIIVDHVDCGAYGGSSRFSSEEEEKDFHRERLAEAKKIAEERYPKLEVAMLYADWKELISI